MLASLAPRKVQNTARMRSVRGLRADLARTVLVLSSLAAPVAGHAAEGLAVEPDASIEEVLVRGQEPGAPELFVVTPNRATPNAPDTSEMMELVPGGGVVNNGPLSGQIQYRGMFGNRVGVQIDEMYGIERWPDQHVHSIQIDDDHIGRVRR